MREHDLMAVVRGPDFIALQVRDLERSRFFYTEQLGLRVAPASPLGAVVFDTQPIPFAVRDPLVDLDASAHLGWGVSLWLAADDAEGLHDRLSSAGVTITSPLTVGPFGPQFGFVDPDGYSVMIHQPDARDPALAELSKADPALAGLIDAHPDFDPRAWLSELPPMDAFGALVFQVIGQQLSVHATRRILDRLAALFGGAMPTPAKLLAVDPEALASVGLSRRKVATIRDVAQRFADGRLREDELRSLSDQEIEDRLTAVPGIGPWTVHGFLIIAFDRKDVVLPGDLALRKAIQYLYEMDHLPSEAEVIALAERWRPWRSLAVAYLFQAGFENDGASHGDRTRSGTRGTVA